MQKQQICWSK